MMKQRRIKGEFDVFGMTECMRHMGKFNSTLNNNKEKSKCKNNKDTDKSKKYLYEKFR